MEDMSIGLPKIEILFKSLAVSAVARSAKGIVALIVEDDTNITFNLKEYKSILDINSTDFTAKNVQYIKDVFAGTPSKVLVARVNTTSISVVADAVEAIGSRKYNWIGLAEGITADQTALVAFVKEQETANKSIKAVAYNVTSPDSMHVVNFTNASVTYATGGTTVTGEKFVARLLGLFAGIPMTQSATYFSFPELASVVEPADVEVAVNAGKLVLFNDDEVVRIARSINSLATLGQDKTEDMKKIIVVESMDMIREDIYSTFKNEYLGKFKNKYDNQVLFISAINSYFDQLADESILDNSFNNVSLVDANSQRQAWLGIGKTEASDWDDAKVREMSFRSNVYLAGNIKILDAIEDLKFNITMV
jgi:hypothetical protein